MQRKTTEDKARLMVNRILTDKSISELVTMIKMYDKELFNHSMNVAFITAQIVRKENILKKTQYDLVTAALLHDIGKVNMPIEVLNKKSSLTPKEYELIKTHVEEGVKILTEAGMKENIIRYVARHHENFDGSGYPLGLTSKELTIEDMIIGAVDKYDALTSDRTYGKEYSSEQALSIMKQEGNINKQVILFINNCVAI